MGFLERISSKKKEHVANDDSNEIESDFLKGIGYYEQQAYEESLKCFRAAAEKGHAGAQYRIGRMYYDGVGVELSEEEALKWFKLAADKGEKESQFVLASMYIRGNGVENISYYEAFKWFKAASESGHPGATMNLGYLYASGSGTAQSDVDAFRCYMSVAEKDNPYAQYSVGNLYLLGIGVEQSEKEALRWYLKAIDNGLSEAKDVVLSIKEGGTVEDDLYYLTEGDAGVVLATVDEWGGYSSGFGMENLFYRDGDEEDLLDSMYEDID